MNAYTILGADGAYTTSIRPHGPGGSPLFDFGVIGFHVLPASSERKRPLPLGESGPSPPERNVQPLRRKSHIPASSTSGLPGSIASDEHPVDAFFPARIFCHVLPPSAVL